VPVLLGRLRAELSSGSALTSGHTHQWDHLSWLFLYFLSKLLIPYPKIPQVDLETVVMQQQARTQSVPVDELSPDAESG